LTRIADLRFACGQPSAHERDKTQRKENKVTEVSHTDNGHRRSGNDQE
jgi:hypothetical protein